MLNKISTLILAGFLGFAAVGNALADLNDGLVAYYPFDGNAEDASGNNIHGMEYGNIKYTDNGYIGKAVQCENSGIKTLTSYFDKDTIIGSNAVESTNYYHSISNQANPQTVSAWFKTSSFDQTDWGGNIAGIGSRAASRLFVGISENFLRVGYGKDGTYINEKLEHITINDGKWHHIAFVSYGNTGEKIIYMDGVERYSFKGGTNGQATQGLYQFCGYSLYNGKYRNNFEGFVDEVRIYNRALSESEVNELYNGETTQECESATHAIYNAGKLTIPFVEVPLLNLYTHEPTGEIAVFSSELKQITNSIEFNLLSYRTKLVFLTATPDPCHAVYDETQKTLHIPFVDIDSEVYDVKFQHIKDNSLEFGTFHLESYDLVQ